MAIRSPIITVLGHVDHGKTTLLDSIRNTSVTRQEAGAITQSIGASLVPLGVIKKLVDKYSSIINVDLKIPGLLFIDTPGHEAFTTLRKRGGSLADLAIVVVDINEGFKPQTIESIKILRAFKTPFIIAANKIDLIYGYSKKSDLLLQDIEQQSEQWRQEFYSKLYSIVGQLYDNFQMDAELFSKANFEKQVAIIPISAKLGVGVSELLILVAGLAQKYLEEQLRINVEGPGKGVVLEVKEVKGLGKAMDVILYDGVLRVNDTIIGIDSMGNPIKARIKTILAPTNIADLRDKKAKFSSIREVRAARGIRLVAPGAEDIAPGSEILVAKTSKDEEEIIQNIKQDIEAITIESESVGVIVKADSLGSLEAIINLLRQEGIAIRRAGLGPINKKDIVEADTIAQEEPLLGVVIGFNVGLEQGLEKPEHIGVITSNIVYEIIDKFKEWQEEKRKQLEQAILKELPVLGKIYVMPNYVFRQSNPAIFGVEVLLGRISVKIRLMKDGHPLGEIREIQLNKESIHEAVKGKQVAISMHGVTISRQIKEGDTLYTFLTEDEYRKYKELLRYLGPDEREILREIAQIMRKENPLWGV
ncbi:translation initiation factor IF-2 [Candidatus Woesearchaeota archaeon]|nr:translation initiation factor IF-2 [Candidatus Woesearchaeota archaeon]